LAVNLKTKVTIQLSPCLSITKEGGCYDNSNDCQSNMTLMTCWRSLKHSRSV